MPNNETRDTAAAPRFISTRGGTEAVSFAQALLTGLAPDGGLYIPDQLPKLHPSDWESTSSFAELAGRVLGKWLGAEIEERTLEALLAEALSFPVPLVPLEGAGWEGVSVLELFHGPTLSFKDFGARTMARLMAHFLADSSDPLTILVATSGDTGSAVADGFAGQDGIRVVLLYPKGQVSPVQEQQLIIERPGVQVFAVEGTFDDCQRLVKAAFADSNLSSLRLSSANSINIGRLLPQMLYYIWAVRASASRAISFCVPSGNLGNLTAGVLAAWCGLSVRHFLAAHNANDFFPRFLRGLDAEMRDSIRTLSNAMDVGAPSNFERLQRLLQGKNMRTLIQGVSVSDADTIASMRRVYEETGYVADPHTAVGLEAVRRFRMRTSGEDPMIVLATAHPAKFPETVEEALGFSPETPSRLAAFWEQQTAVMPLAPNMAALRGHLLR
ncbi:MAG TPA: threonine synthase [Rhodothermales bacterium]|nr:threonine synthase [Rhodothermales bacterium]